MSMSRPGRYTCWHIHRATARLRQLNFTKMLTNQTQPTKCQFMKQELKYLGHILSVDGIKPDPARVEAIQKSSTLHDKFGVSRILGQVTHLPYKVLPNLANQAQSLQNLTRKEVLLTWDVNYTRTLAIN